MASGVDRWRPPAREGYSLPTSSSLPPKPPNQSRSPSAKRDVPPAVPSPPTNSSRRSPLPPNSRRGASPAQSSRAPPRPSQPRANQWYFTLNETLSSPSILDGLTPTEEKTRRAKGINFIFQAGILLDLPMTTLWVAAVFFHRFYMRISMVEEKSGIHHYNIAATALFLSTKTEENCKKTKDIIIAVAKVAQKNDKLIIDEQSKEYWRWRDSIMMYEELMLEILTFDLMIPNLYKKLYHSLELVHVLRHKPIREAAWSFLNDSLHTVLPLLMDYKDIATSAIFFGSHSTDEKIDDINDEPWWKYLRGNEDNMNLAITLMMDFYSQNPLRKKVRYEGSPIFNLDSTRRSGEIPSQLDLYSSQNGTPQELDRGTQSPRKSDRNTEVNGKVEPPKEHVPREDAPKKGNTKEEVPEDEAPKEDRDTSFDAQTEEATQPHGDSDAILKAAANNLDHKGKSNGNGIFSPETKRKSPETDNNSDGVRERKRARLSGDDEGEIEDA